MWDAHNLITRKRDTHNFITCLRPRPPAALTLAPRTRTRAKR